MPHKPLCPLRLQTSFHSLQPRTIPTHTHAHVPVSNTLSFTHNQNHTRPNTLPLLITTAPPGDAAQRLYHADHCPFPPPLAQSDLFLSPSLELLVSRYTSHTCLHVTTPTSTHICTSSTLPQTHVLKHTPPPTQTQTQTRPHALLHERSSSASDVLLATPSRASTSRPAALMPQSASPSPRVRIPSQHHA